MNPLGSSAPVCPLCGSSNCNDVMASPNPLIEEPSPVTQRMYTVIEAIWENGSQVYPRGSLMPLDEAVRRGLPGAAQAAVGGRKPTHSPENRDALTEGDRDAPR